MALAKITLLTFEDYLNHEKKSLFDDIVIPTNLDKQTLVDEILLSCGEMEVLYTQPFFYKKAIEHFFLKYKRTFEKWVQGLDLEYNPIENYDRMEEWTDNDTSENSNSGTSESNGEISGTSSVTNEGTNENKVSAFDSSDYQPKDQMQSNAKETQETGNESNSKTQTKSSGSSKNDSKHVGRIHGNIGVTTNEQMQEAFIELYGRYNIYTMICDIFKTEMVLAVYD